MEFMGITKVVVGGFSSNVGKTTLVCDLLNAFPGWEAIKVTRGHFRSCGKDPHACCVSHLLGDEPLVHSGRPDTDAPGKDTGRFWEAGASNVHWVVATDGQVERGVRAALARVAARGVFVEGNSFARFVEADLFVMVARSDAAKIKPTARRTLSKVSALYLSTGGGGSLTAQQIEEWRERTNLGVHVADIPVYTRETMPSLIEAIHAAHSRAAEESRVEVLSAAKI